MANDPETRTPETEPDRFDAWVERLASRTFGELTFPEVRRALQALSDVYVARRDRIVRGAALDGRGKRAAFALFYGPLHYLLARECVRRLGLDRPGLLTVTDLGCGTGVAGAAWSLACSRRPAVHGVDVHPWAVEQARRTYDELGVSGQAARGRIERVRIDHGDTHGIVAGWVVNELDAAARDTLLGRLVDAGRSGSRVLVLEPIARRPVPWWDAWASDVQAAGGRADVWKITTELPGPVARLDRAARLDHRVLSARTLAIGAEEIKRRDRSSA